jgi:cytochrome c oxidase cbb3-type subunit 2
MSRSSNIFAGLFGSFLVSVGAMVLVPQKQLGKLEPVFTEEEGRFSDIYPIENGAANQGRQIYVEQGCYVCHTQQIRDTQNGTDIARGWGARRTVARDYLYDGSALLGNSRLGPDLANVGAKDWRNEPKEDIAKPKVRDAAWHYLHLYAPQQTLHDSNHPPYTFLFEEKTIAGQPSEDALKLIGDNAPAAGKQVVPNPKAKALVSYLLSLDRSHALPEANPAGPAPAAAPAPSAPAASTAPAAPAAK